jgi:hypothetical protein
MMKNIEIIPICIRPTNRVASFNKLFMVLFSFNASIMINYALTINCFIMIII